MRITSRLSFLAERGQMSGWVNTLWWAIPNLIVPLLTIPIVMGIQWLFQKQPSFQAIIEDGQVCFYSIAVLAAAWYDLKSFYETSNTTGNLDTLIFFVGALATLGYGIMASDHVGAKTLSRSRAAVVSTVLGLASIAVAIQVHHTVAAVAHP